MPIIDHIDQVDVDHRVGLNELTTIECLSAGLDALALQVHTIEQPLIQREQERGRRIMAFGFGFLPAEVEPLVPCFFHWYGTSLCNYARLVGFLKGLSTGAFTRAQAADPRSHKDVVKAYCDGYVHSIAELVPILVWRNKVFAHFAITDPRKTDNAALLDASVMSPIAFANHRLRVGAMIYSKNGEDAALPEWSVTESHEALASRYWPREEVCAATWPGRSSLHESRPGLAPHLKNGYRCCAW